MAAIWIHGFSNSIVMLSPIPRDAFGLRESGLPRHHQSNASRRYISARDFVKHIINFNIFEGMGVRFKTQPQLARIIRTIYVRGDA